MGGLKKSVQGTSLHSPKMKEIDFIVISRATTQTMNFRKNYNDSVYTKYSMRIKTHEYNNLFVI